MEEMIAGHIKKLLRKPPPLEESVDPRGNTESEFIRSILQMRNSLDHYPDKNPSYTNYILSEHLQAASHLSEGHPVRMILASALVANFLGVDFKFEAEMAEIPTLARDVLVATKAAIGYERPLGSDGRRLLSPDRHVAYTDPITKKPMGYGKCSGCRGNRRAGHDPLVPFDDMRVGIPYRE